MAAFALGASGCCSSCGSPSAGPCPSSRRAIGSRRRSPRRRSSRHRPTCASPACRRQGESIEPDAQRAARRDHRDRRRATRRCPPTRRPSCARRRCSARPTSSSRPPRAPKPLPEGGIAGRSRRCRRPSSSTRSYAPSTPHAPRRSRLDAGAGAPLEGHGRTSTTRSATRAVRRGRRPAGRRPQPPGGRRAPTSSPTPAWCSRR